MTDPISVFMFDISVSRCKVNTQWNGWVQTTGLIG